MPSKRIAILFENFPSDYPYNLHRNYLRILNKLMRLWDTARFDLYMKELLLNSRNSRNGFPPEVVDELLFIDRLHEACQLKGIRLPAELDWKSLPHKCYSPESFEVMIREASVDEICFCFDQNIPVDFRFNNGSTPLIVAAEEGRQEVVDFLLDSGANPNARNDLNYTALHWAAFRGQLGIVELLLKNGADANVKDSTGASSLLMAISRGHPLVAVELIAGGASVDKAKMVEVAARKGLNNIVAILRMQSDSAG